MRAAPPRRLVYLGSPQAAVPPLRALVEAGFEVGLVVSQPDRKRGRGGSLTPSPVKAAALELGLDVSDDVRSVLGVNADLGVVVAYGQLIKQDILDVVPMVNLHFSLLPRWRGAAPVERAVLAGDHETGVCLMALEAGLDTGSVYECVTTLIDDDETAQELRERLVVLGTQLLVRNLTEGLGEPKPQEGESTYAAKINPAELEIDWHRSADEIARLVRIGGAWTVFRSKRLKVLRVTRAHAPSIEELSPGAISLTSGELRVGTGDHALALLELQPEGKGRNSAREWANGARPANDERFGNGIS